MSNPAPPNRSIRLFQTAVHACGYYPERAARDLVLDPGDPQLPALYPLALAQGFRRSGGQVYRPRCPDCTACTPLRIPVAGFRPDRSQRRCLRRNADLDLQTGTRTPGDEHYALYRRYLDARHRGGGMDAGTRGDFEQFLRCGWSPTRLFELRLGAALVAVAVTDVFADALSAVYTFYEPALAGRGLGTCAILRQIDWARRHGLAHVYLGFHIAGHPKMDYKARFGPAEVLDGAHWRALVPDAATG